VARELLGHELVWRGPGGRLGGIIVEVEAYGGADDPASHAHRGPTARNRVMFGHPGHAYVYFTYGMHHCVNVVTEAAGRPGAVLVRALRPRSNLALWRVRRPDLPLERAASGPGRVARALGLTRTHDGLDLTGSELVILRRDTAGLRVRSGPRVGIRQARDVPWRFWVPGEPAVSRSRGSHPGPWPGDGKEERG
jgi:DNA-3-methyladenine glycosylase